MATTLPAQFSLQLEQGITISDVVKYKPIGIGINYQVSTWKGFDLSVGLAFDQVTLETDLPRTQEAPTCPNASFFCNFGPAGVTSRESRLLLPVGISRRTHRLTYGLQIRPGLRIHDAVDLTYPVLFSDIAGETRTVAVRYGEAEPNRFGFTDNGKYKPTSNPIHLQLGMDFTYDLSERLGVGLNYRYEGLMTKQVEVMLTDFYGTRPTGADPVYFREQSQVHYLSMVFVWRL
jgi:hypothetical protein